MPFKFHKLAIKDVVLIETAKFKDERGFFEEVFKVPDFDIAIAPVPLTFNSSVLGCAVLALTNLIYTAAPSTRAKPGISTSLVPTLPAVEHTP